MTDTVIKVENLSKRYRLGTIGGKTLREDVQRRWAKLRGKPDPLLKIGQEDHGNISGENLWALRDIGFEVKRGEILGIIGRNGAGKSTLLKVVSQITAPTSGEIKIKGRIGCLLEVGTGFHPELTGLENIYLNGAILGMSKVEVNQNIDNIIEFSELKNFIDTPVKRYSSGMYVRLAFAVAAHLDPEILVVDEVLAVGDVKFQKKCIGKMGDVSKDGRTVLFVSHNMASIQHLCNRAILMNKGSIVSIGKTQNIVSEYLKNSVELNGKNIEEKERPSWAKPIITEVFLTNIDGETENIFSLGFDIIIGAKFDVGENSGIKDPVFGVVINHVVFGPVAGVNTRMTAYKKTGGPFSKGRMQCVLRNLPLLQGHYNIDVWIGDGPDNVDTLSSALKFQVIATDIYSSGHPPFESMGSIFLKPEWEFVF